MDILPRVIALLCACETFLSHIVQVVKESESAASKKRSGDEVVYAVALAAIITVESPFIHIETIMVMLPLPFYSITGMTFCFRHYRLADTWLVLASKGCGGAGEGG